ncbi:hypothetical protein Tco_0232126 [Tanacetum coccineum]
METDEGLQDGNTGNGGATGQVHEVTNDDKANEADLEFVMKEAPTSYPNKLSSTSLTKANLHKLAANVPNDTDFELVTVGSVYEVNDRMKNSLYCYFIGKGLLSLWVNLDRHENWYPNDASLIYEFHVFGIMSYNLVMAVSNLEGPGYTKEIIRVEYEVDKGKVGSSEADDEGFVEVKNKKLGGNNGKKNVLILGNSSKKTSMTNA